MQDMGGLSSPAPSVDLDMQQTGSLVSSWACVHVNAEHQLPLHMYSGSVGARAAIAIVHMAAGGPTPVPQLP